MTIKSKIIGAIKNPKAVLPIKKHHPDFEPVEHFHKRKIKLDRFDNLDVKIRGKCFLKVDTEGHELEVLKGFGKRLEEVDVVLFEHCFRPYFSNQGKLGDTFNLLEKYGFNGVKQINTRKIGVTLTFCDWVFFRI